MAIEASLQTLMNLPRHNRRLRRIVRRNRYPVIQSSTRGHALRRSTASAQEREPRGTPTVNLRARTCATTRNGQVILARLQRRTHRPAQSFPSCARRKRRSRSVANVCNNIPRTIQHSNVIRIARVIRGRNIVGHLRSAQRKRQHYAPQLRFIRRARKSNRRPRRTRREPRDRIRRAAAHVRSRHVQEHLHRCASRTRL